MTQCKTSHLRPCHVQQSNQRNYGVSGSRILIQQRNQGVDFSADIESVEDQGAGHSLIKQSSCVPGVPAPPAPLLPPRSGIARIEERRGRTAWHQTQLLLFDEVTNFRHLVPQRIAGLLPAVISVFPCPCLHVWLCLRVCVCLYVSAYLCLCLCLCLLRPRPKRKVTKKPLKELKREKLK